jgi:membrane protease YdiL (CAAX protease family)
MIEEREERPYSGDAPGQGQPIVDNGGQIADFGADGITETVAELDMYAVQDRKKIVAGSFFFLFLVVLHIAEGFLLDIKDTTTSILVTQFSVLIPALIYMSLFKINPFKFMRFKKFHLGSAFLIPLFMIAVLPVMSLFNLISQLFSTNIIGNSLQDILTGGLFSSLLIVAALPAFVEETSFRGAIYGSLRGCRPVRAIVLSGFMFGLMHMNLNQFVYATVLGIVMGFLLEATGSIISTMILHFCFNANSVILLWAMPKFYNYMSQYTGNNIDMDELFNSTTRIPPSQILTYIAIFIPIAAVGGAFAYLFYYLIAKLNNRWYYIKFLFSKDTKMQRSTFPKPKLITVWAIIAIIICLGMCVLNELAVRGIFTLA